jgi:hypothetical protein
MEPIRYGYGAIFSVKNFIKCVTGYGYRCTVLDAGLRMVGRSLPIGGETYRCICGFSTTSVRGFETHCGRCKQLKWMLYAASIIVTKIKEMYINERHTNRGNRYICTLCGKGFRYIDDTLMHFVNEHPDVVRELASQL